MPQFIELTDFSLPILQAFNALSEAQLLHYYEPDLGIFVAESAMVIGRALDAGYEPIALISERKRAFAQEAAILERCGDVPVYIQNEEVLNDFLGFKLVRGPLCVMRRKPVPDAETLCKNARRIAVLEHVTNPTNVGAIVRSAAALGIEAVLLTEGCADPLYRRAERVSMGTAFRMPWGYLSEDRYIDLDKLHRMGFQTAAMALREDSVSIADPALRKEEKLAILLGEEGYGLCDETIRGADYTVLIPMAPGIDSLNVAAASAVAFWELRSR